MGPGSLTAGAVVSEDSSDVPRPRGSRLDGIAAATG